MNIPITIQKSDFVQYQSSRAWIDRKRASIRNTDQFAIVQARGSGAVQNRFLKRDRYIDTTVASVSHRKLVDYFEGLKKGSPVVGLGQSLLSKTDIVALDSLRTMSQVESTEGAASHSSEVFADYLKRGSSLDEGRSLRRRTSAKALAWFGSRKRRSTDPSLNTSSGAHPREAVGVLVDGNVGVCPSELAASLRICRGLYASELQQQTFDLAVADTGNGALGLEYAAHVSELTSYTEQLIRACVRNGSALAVLRESMVEEIKKSLDSKNPTLLFRSRSRSTLLCTAYMQHPGVGGTLLPLIAARMREFLQQKVGNRAKEFWVSITDMERAGWQGVKHCRVLRENRKRFLAFVGELFKEACYQPLLSESNLSLRHLLGLRYGLLKEHFATAAWVYVGELVVLRGLVPAMSIESSKIADSVLRSVYVAAYRFLQSLSTGVKPGEKTKELEFLDDTFEAYRAEYLKFLQVLTKEPPGGGSIHGRIS